MSGIVGIIGLGKPIAKMERYFGKMAGDIQYGKDDLFTKSRGMFHVLGVASISAGPDGPKLYTNGDGTVLCLIDGEVIVNDEVSLSVPETDLIDGRIGRQGLVPYLYDEYGPDFLRYLKGCFNIVIFDKKRTIYRIMSCRFGMRVLYFAQIDGYFLFSSSLKSLMQCSLIHRNINRKAVFEYALFHYPLGDDTFFEKVKILEPATILTINGSGATEEKYWDQESLFGHKLSSVDDSIEGADYRLTSAVNRMHINSDRIGISLTGGFDTRTILSLLDRDHKDILLYSFGSHLSEDMTVPESISNVMDYEYYPIYLDGDYESRFFNKYARLAVMYSDGRGSIARAHYPYAFEQLGARVKTVLTGICGSELLRPLSNVGAVISENTRLLYAKGIGSIRQLLSEGRPLRYFRIPVTGDFIGQIEESVNKIKSFNNRSLPLNQRLYVFILKEVLRKYFGPEISMENPYVDNKIPFLDYEFVDFIFSTPFCGANYGFFVRNPLDRMRGQQFYAYIINKHDAELARLDTDRKYAPRDLITNKGKIRVATKYLSQRSRRSPSDDYGLLRGVRTFMSSNSDTILRENEFLNIDRILDDFNSGYWTRNLVEFCKAISFAFWKKYFLV